MLTRKLGLGASCAIVGAAVGGAVGQTRDIIYTASGKCYCVKCDGTGGECDCKTGDCK